MSRILCIQEFYSIPLLCRSPFLDIYDTMMAPVVSLSSSLLTAHEYDEWGNPHTDSRIADYIRRYCPLTNVIATRDNSRDQAIEKTCSKLKQHCSVYISIGEHDSLVNPKASLKFAASLRSSLHSRLCTDAPVTDRSDISDTVKVIVDVIPNGDHEGAKDPVKNIDTLATEITFLEDAIK